MTILYMTELSSYPDRWACFFCDITIVLQKWAFSKVVNLKNSSANLQSANLAELYYPAAYNVPIKSMADMRVNEDDPESIAFIEQENRRFFDDNLT